MIFAFRACTSLTLRNHRPDHVIADLLLPVCAVHLEAAAVGGGGVNPQRGAVVLQVEEADIEVAAQ